MTNASRVTIDVDGEEVRAYLAGTSGRRPAIVILHEIFGANEAMRRESEMLAAAGYLVCVPDLYHRVAPGTELLYSDDERDLALDLWKRLDADLEGSIVTIARVVDHVRAHPNCDGRVALIGFCLGGKLALLAAARNISNAAVAFYPVQMHLHRRALEQSPVPVQVQLGDADTHIPPEVVEALESTIDALAESELVVHPGAGHGFYNPVRTIGFDAPAAAAARERMLNFLDLILGKLERR